MSASFDFPELDGFVAGAVGPPGQRVFYLQAVNGSRVVSLQLEKQQVALLADYLAQLLDMEDLVEGDEPRHLELAEPAVAEWTVGSLMVAVNQASGKVVVIAEELTPDEESTGADARFGLTRRMLERFVDQARTVVQAGRTPCRLCGRPIDPEGHACPRLN